MSELVQKNDNHANARWLLLTSASALALAAGTASVAIAADADRPQVWIELGGQLNRLDGGNERFSPDLMSDRPEMFSPSVLFERGPRHSFDEFGQLTFQPNNSEWSFAASVRFGRASSNRHVRQQTYPNPHVKYVGTGQFTEYPRAARFADTVSREAEQRLIVDFQVGKDVGIGLFNSQERTSTVSLGIRFAQFTSKSDVALQSNPDWHFKYYTYGNVQYVIGQPYHSNFANLAAKRSFHGLGPSLSFKSTIPVAGNGQDSELTVDWGLNAAMLFGKQKARIHHQATGWYQYGGFFDFSNIPPRQLIYQPPPVNAVRSKSVTVPNVGAFAGLSFRYDAAKVSFGYRADFFFGAMDGGINARKSSDRNFYGPFASVSIGLGE
ncbi:MAG TPA: hypothetical protein VHD95_10810 [Rhizomicrobium sp.]|jgi:hypothetical protein|nr:hypothetical protein [Rhizomicrobium sp.]